MLRSHALEKMKRPRPARTRRLRRFVALLFVGSLGTFLLPAAPAYATVTCVFDGVDTAFVDANVGDPTGISSDSVTMSVAAGGEIMVDEGGGPNPCTADGGEIATVFNTNTIQYFDQSLDGRLLNELGQDGVGLLGSTEFTIDLSGPGGPFQRPSPPAPDNSVKFDLIFANPLFGLDFDDTLHIIGTSGIDNIIVGDLNNALLVEGGGALVNLDGDGDADITYEADPPLDGLIDFTLGGDANLIDVVLGDGDDFFSAQGGSATGGPALYSVSVDGGLGNDDIFGGNASDTIRGGSGDDRITGGAGDEILRGQGEVFGDVLDYSRDVGGGGVGEDDPLVMPEQADSNNACNVCDDVSDTSGDTDSVVGFEHFEGSAGPDNVTMKSGNNIINGYEGDDQLSGAAGDDEVHGHQGNDFLGDRPEIPAVCDILGLPTDIVICIILDLLLGPEDPTDPDEEPGQDFLDGGVGNDTIGGGQDNLVDVIVGDIGDDVIKGGGGGDDIRAGAGNDTILGEAGNDRILGNSGNDIMEGTAGNDTLSGGPGEDVIKGFEGNDTLRGGDDNDKLFAHQGNDTLTSGAGDDILQGLSGRDGLSGAGGDDIMNGGVDDDVLSGGSGNDTLRGGKGIDSCHGGSGNNTFRGCQRSDER